MRGQGLRTSLSWRGFLGRLLERGLKPSDLVLVISDEHNGLKKAASEVLGDVPHQLCWAHRMRNIRKQVSAEDRGEVVAGLQFVYKARHLEGAKDAFRRWKAKWQVKYPIYGGISGGGPWVSAGLLLL